MEQINASIIILNYNSYDDIAILLRQISKRTFENIALNFIIVDNASPKTSGKEEVLALLGDQDFFIQSEENGGYARGNNIGLRKAIGTNAKYGFILNPDIELEDEMIFFNMVKDAEQLGANFLMCGPIVNGVPPFTLRPEISELLVPSKFRQKVVASYAAHKGKAVIPAYRVYGCFFLADLKAFSKIDWFDEDTFLYNEEAIVAEKAIKHNLKIYILNDYVVKHNASKSVNETFRIKKYKFLQESTYVYLHKHREVNSLSATLISYIIYCFTFYRDYLKRKVLSFKA